MRKALLASSAALLVLACHPRVQIGDPLRGLTREQRRLFDEGKTAFGRTFTPEEGLGPLFNADSCGECHESPVPGGSGDEVEVHSTKFVPPDVCDPLFQEGGPVIQQRATPLLKAKGIEKEQIPPSATGQAHRSTPPLFGFGLLDAIPDETILAYEDPNDANGDGVSGRANRFSDGRIGRFGRKAFVPTLREFNAGAFPVEEGVTTPLQPVEETINGRPVPPDTDPAPEPEVPESEIDAVTRFIQFLAPPPPDRVGDDSQRRTGEHLFQQIGCAKCHVPEMKTGPSDIEALDRKNVYLYSDLLLHDMGPELADICLGLATPSEFRTEPLLGLRFREHFLHDGSAASVTEAIERHAGEAESERSSFAQLSEQDKQALLQFLSSI